MQAANWIYHGVENYLQHVRKFNRNIRLLLVIAAFSYFAQGIFSVDFNLYILSLGILPDGLGRILSAAPFAHMLAAIPVGFLAEWFGFRKSFLVIYALTGLALLSQAISPNVVLITAAAFMSGLAISGDFVVRLPFIAANTEGPERNHVFGVDALLTGIFFALGALAAGHLPNLLTFLSPDETVRYRFTLYLAGIVMMLAVIPVLLMKDRPLLQRRKISLAPYLWAMDRFTRRGATIEFFLGLTFGLVVPFMNVFFLYRLGTTREYFSSIEALVFFPAMIATAIGPVLAGRWGQVNTFKVARFTAPVCMLAMALTSLPIIGAVFYWIYKAQFNMSQAIWFSYGMETSAPRAKAALSSWLEISYQFGMMVSAPLTGILLMQSNYATPFYLAGAAALVAAVLTHFFMGKPVSVREPAQAAEEF